MTSQQKTPAPITTDDLRLRIGLGELFPKPSDAALSALASGRAKIAKLADVDAYAICHQENVWLTIEIVTAPRVTAQQAEELLDHCLKAVSGPWNSIRTWIRPNMTLQNPPKGWRLARELLRMTTSLVDQIEPGDPALTRPYQPTDLQDLVAINNRAFKDHPEQAAWTAEAFNSRTQQPWFDPQALRVIERDGSTAGFCWIKVTNRSEGSDAEVYVIAIDPKQSGKGLGRKLLLSSIAHVRKAGINTISLFVEATNTVATQLYESLGLTTTEVHRQYELIPKPESSS